MKKLMVLALALAAVTGPALAAERNIFRPICTASGNLNKNLLEMALDGENPVVYVLGEFDSEYAANTAITMLMMAKDTWENRMGLTPTMAFMSGYNICMKVHEGRL